MGGQLIASDDEGATFLVRNDWTGDPVTAVYVPFGPEGSGGGSRHLTSIRRSGGGRPPSHGPPAGYQFGRQERRFWHPESSYRIRGPYGGYWHNPKGIVPHNRPQRRPEKPLLGTKKTSWWYQQNARRHRRRKRRAPPARSSKVYRWNT